MTGVVTVKLIMGNSENDVFAPFWNDISQELVITELRPTNVTIAVPGNDPTASSSCLAEALRHAYRDAGVLASVVTPSMGGVRLQRVLAPSRSMHGVDLRKTASRFDRLLVDPAVTGPSMLIGVSHLGETGNPGPVAIGLWTGFADPRLAIPIHRSRRRHPDAADIALAFSSSTIIVTAFWKGYVVLVVGRDLVAVELVGLAVSAAKDSDAESRQRPWEDPVVQRATEIDLGIERPGQIGFYPEWAGPTDPDGKAALADLSLTVGELLNLEDYRTEPSTDGVTTL